MELAADKERDETKPYILSFLLNSRSCFGGLYQNLGVSWGIMASAA